MDLEIAGKTAIVTGGSRGIGRAIADRLAREGARVVISARGAADIERAVAEMRAAGLDVDGMATDVSNPAAAPELVARAIERFGSVDILVNNAGGQRSRGNFDTLTDQDYFDAFTDNVLSIVRMCRAALPHMQARQWGRVVNITSEVATQPDRIYQNYAAAKGAALNLSKSLSKAYARDGILVNAVSPGLIETSAVGASFAQGAVDQGRPEEAVRADFFRKFKPGLVLGRAGTPGEVASVVALLCSPLASYVTGAEVRVDGGSVVGL